MEIMNPTFTRSAQALLVVALAAGGNVALTALAEAQTAASPPAAAPMPPRPPMERGEPGRRGEHGMMRELERFRTSLKLDARQAALWDRALATMTPPGDRREKMKAERERVSALFDDPNFDPRKLGAEMDSRDAERRARMTATRDAWFAVYDSLNPVQRGQAREFLRSRMSRPHGMGGMGPMGAMHRHGGDGPPMPR